MTKKTILVLCWVVGIATQGTSQHFTLFDSLRNSQVIFKRLPLADSLAKVHYYDVDSLHYKRTFIIEKSYSVVLNDFSATYQDSLAFSGINVQGQYFTFAQLAKNGNTPWQPQYVHNFTINWAYRLKHRQHSKEHLVLFTTNNHSATMGFVNTYVLVFELDQHQQVKAGFMYTTATVAGTPCLGSITDVDNDGQLEFLQWHGQGSRVYYYTLNNGKAVRQISTYQVVKRWNKALRYYQYKLVGG